MALWCRKSNTYFFIWAGAGGRAFAEWFRKFHNVVQNRTNWIIDFCDSFSDITLKMQQNAYSECA